MSTMTMVHDERRTSGELRVGAEVAVETQRLVARRWLLRGVAHAAFGVAAMPVVAIGGFGLLGLSVYFFYVGGSHLAAAREMNSILQSCRWMDVG